MKRLFGIPLIALASCNTVPEKPNFTASLQGNYQAIADCAYIEFRKLDSAWTKADYPSMSRTDFIFGIPGGGTAGEIKISASGPNTTMIESHVQAAIGRPDFWANKHRPIFETCSAQLAAAVTAQ